MQKNKLKSKNIIVALIAAAVILFIIYANSTYNKKSVAYVESKPLASFTPNTNIDIYSTYNDSFYLTTGSETKLIDVNGNEKWAYANNFNSPLVSSKGEYLAVRELNKGSQINVFNSKGLLYSTSINTQSKDTKILDDSINKNGYLAVLTNGTSGYTIKVYDNNGTVIMTSVMAKTDNTYPISIDISADNKILAVASIDSSKLHIGSSISLSYINNTSDNIETIEGVSVFAGLLLKDEVIGKIEFNGSNLIAYTDLGIKILDTKTLQNKKEIVINNKIDEFKILNNNNICIATGPKTGSSDFEVGTVLIYNMKGELIGKNIKGSKVKSLMPSNSGVIVTETKRIYEISSNGNILWEYSPNKDFIKAAYIGKKYLAILIGNSDIVGISKN